MLHYNEKEKRETCGRPEENPCATDNRNASADDNFWTETQVIFHTRVAK